MGMQVETDNRKPYEKPQLRVIELAAEEVLAAGCKLASGGTAMGSPFPPCNIGGCSQSGS